MSLGDLNPLYECPCGRRYFIIVPGRCYKCREPTPKLPGTVPFDPAKYRAFCDRVKEIGFEAATNELLNKE